MVVHAEAVLKLERISEAERSEVAMVFMGICSVIRRRKLGR